MIKNFLLITSLISQFFFISCKKDAVSPIEKTQPGRRDYIWSVDTLYSPNNILYTVWGAASNDLWLGGPGGITDYDMLWHFDGNKWQPSTQKIHTYPNSLFGFSNNDIWIGGNDGEILHYDGTTWKLIYTYRKDGVHTIDIKSVFGRNSTDLFASGLIIRENDEQRAFLLHYNGKTWKEIFVANSQSQFLFGRTEGEKSYLFDIEDYINTVIDTFCIYEINRNNYKKIFSKTNQEIDFASFDFIGNKIYFLINRDLCNYENGVFKKLMSFNQPEFRFRIKGRSLTDFFISMKDGLAHYNGNNIEYLYRFDHNISLSESIIFEKEVIFTAYDYANSLNLILRGKLE